jgi:acyl carrier protein
MKRAMADEEILAVIAASLGDVAHAVRASVTMESSLAELGIDSVAAFELAGRVEASLSIQFPDDELAQVDSIKEFVRLVRRATAS